MRSRLAFFVVAVAPALPAQSTGAWEHVKQLAPGSQIRVNTMDGHKVQGGLQSATDDAVVLATSKSSPAIGRATIKKISVKRKSHRGRNALIGLGVGAAGGLVAGEIHDHGCPASGCAFIGTNAGKEVLTPRGADRRDYRSSEKRWTSSPVTACWKPQAKLLILRRLLKTPAVSVPAQ